MFQLKAFFITCFFITLGVQAQEKQKDTLFFEYDKKYILAFPEIPNQYYLKDSGWSSNGAFFFSHEQVKFNLVPKQILNLKKFVRSSEFYQNKKIKDYEMWRLFDQHIIFLVKKTDSKTTFIEVSSGFEIE